MVTALRFSTSLEVTSLELTIKKPYLPLADKAFKMYELD
jgi:hypothetical protein